MEHISVIIPTWLEAPLIVDAVRRAFCVADEVIVVDAGSPDGTAALAEAAGARVLRAPKGRGIQIDAGARAARCEILVFLHADARLPPESRKALQNVAQDPRVAGGNFRIAFLPESWFTRWLVGANDVRRRITRRYYGDSGIFVRRTTYHELGGVKPTPLMSDYDFSVRLERHGRCAYIRHVPILASDRRFRGRELRTLLLWMTLQTLYSLGIPGSVLARAYPDVRDPDPSIFLREIERRLGPVENETRPQRTHDAPLGRE